MFWLALLWAALILRPCGVTPGTSMFASLLLTILWNQSAFLCHSSKNLEISCHWTHLDPVPVSGPVTVTKEMNCPSQLVLAQMPTPGTWVGQHHPKHMNW